MRTLLRQLLLAVVALTGSSCAKDRVYTVLDRSTAHLRQSRHPRDTAKFSADTLRMLTLLRDEAGMRMVTRIAVGKRLALVGDQLTTPHVIVLDLRAKRVIARVLPHGTDRQEALDAQFVTFTDSMSAWVLDSRTQRVFLVDLTRPSDPRARSAFGLAGRALPYRAMEIRPNGAALELAGSFADVGLVILDTLSRRLERLLVPLPFDSMAMPARGSRAYANLHRSASAPGTGKLAVAYQFRPRLDLWSADRTVVASVDGPRQTVFSFASDMTSSNSWLRGSELAYVDVAATDHFVYALFCGCAPFSRFADRIHVFDWHGDFAAELVLDRGIYRIGVTPDDSLVLGATWAPSPAIGIWPLPKPLRLAKSPRAAQ